MSWGILTRLGATVAVGLALVGCDSIRGSQEPVTTSSDLYDGATACMSDAIVFRQYNREAWGEKLESPKNPDDNPAVVCPRGKLDRKQYRDMIIGYRMGVLDKRFDEFTKSLHVTKTGIGLGADILDALLDAAGTLFGSKGTKSILSAASGIANSGKDAFDVNVFFKKTVDALIAKMEANRDAVKAAIRTKQKESDETYSLDAAFDDLGRMQRAASIDRAVAGLTEDAKKDAKTASDNLDAVTINRPIDLQKYLVSEAGIKRLASFQSAVAKLSAEQAVALGIQSPPVKNPEADAAIETAFGKKDFSKLDAAAKTNASIAILRRWKLAKSQDELGKWEEAIESAIVNK